MSKSKGNMSTKTIASCALLAAMNVVLSRMLGFMPTQAARFSLEAVPVILSGILFGPLAGAMVGFTGDFVGCLFSPFGYNPIYCIPPILYGLSGGLFRKLLKQKVSLPRLALTVLPPVALGSVLWQSAVLSFMQFEGSFLEGYLSFLATRSVQFAVTYVLDVAVLYLLFSTGIFTRMGLWQSAD